MSLNERLGSVESRINDLVSSFDSFTTKFLIIMSIALVTLFVALMYAIKVITERTAPNLAVSSHNRKVTNMDYGIQCKMMGDDKFTKKKEIKDKFNKLPGTRSATACTELSIGAKNCVDHSPDSRLANTVNKVIAHSSSVNRPNKGNSSNASNTASRPNSNALKEKSSCCSMCCEDDDKRS